MVNRGKITMTIAAVLLLVFGATSLATTEPPASLIDKLPQQLQESVTAPVFDINEHRYEYRVRIYVVEPDARWFDNDGYRYRYGFLDFAMNEDVTLTYTDTFSTTVGWVGAQHGYGDISEGNIEVIAVVFDSEWYWGHAYPQENSNLFHVHQVQRAAKAAPGETAYDEHSDGYSHTIFLEEGTATW